MGVGEAGELLSEGTVLLKKSRRKLDDSVGPEVKTAQCHFIY